MRYAAERFVAEYRQYGKQPAVVEKPALPTGVSPQAIAELKAAERAESARKVKAAIDTEIWNREHSTEQ